MTRRNLYLTALAASIILLTSAQSKAQDAVNSYHVGERIEYKASSYPEAWMQGTVIRVDPQYNQLLVRWDPRPDYPQYTHNRKNESIGKLGFVTINANGTYVWKVNPADPPAKYVKGTWRKATAKEMNLQGGAGLVLQKAAEGSDWLVFKYMNPYNKGDAIDMRQIYTTGGYRRIGWRR